MNKITVKIVEKLNDYIFIINAGNNKNIHHGMELKFIESSTNIYDPDTNEYLGNINNTSNDNMLTISRVEDKFSICTLNEKDAHKLKMGKQFKNLKSLGIIKTNKDINVGDCYEY